MKHTLRMSLLLLLTIMVLTVSALADSGPKPQLIVRLENPPEELYYLDLLEEGSAAGEGYANGEDQELNADLVDTLLAAIPEGWHACTLQITSGAPIWGDILGEFQGTDAEGGDRLHTFGYFGVPDVYRIIVATKSGETWVSDVCSRSTLQSSVTVDWAEKTVSVPPVWVGYVLEFLATCLPTLLIEGAVLLAFGYHLRKSWKPFLLANLVTQLGVFLTLGVSAVTNGVSWWWYYFQFIPVELAVLLAEFLFYRRFLTEQGPSRAAAYALTANLCSAAAGWFLAEPVWRFIVSIS